MKKLKGLVFGLVIFGGFQACEPGAAPMPYAGKVKVSNRLQFEDTEAFEAQVNAGACKVKGFVSLEDKNGAGEIPSVLASVLNADSIIQIGPWVIKISVGKDKVTAYNTTSGNL